MELNVRLDLPGWGFNSAAEHLLAWHVQGPALGPQHTQERSVQ